jgi:polar amino acid transport system substrate-binding protein
MRLAAWSSLVGLATLIGVACGSAAPASPPPATTAPAAPTAVGKPTTAAVAASGPAVDAIKQKKELVVGVEAAFEPFETLNNGQFEGFDIDLSNLVAEPLGAKATFVDTEYPGLIPGLQQSKFDVVISAIVITEERAKQVEFSQPYAESTQKVVVRNDDQRITSNDDLRGKTVAVQAGTTSEQLLRKLDADFKQNGDGLKDITVFDHTPEMFLELDTRRADAAITLLPSANLMIKKNPNKYRAAADFGPKSYVGIVTRKNTPDLSQYFDQQLAAIKSSGKLAELETKWFGASSSGLPDKKLY